MTDTLTKQSLAALQASRDFNGASVTLDGDQVDALLKLILTMAEATSTPSNGYEVGGSAVVNGEIRVFHRPVRKGSVNFSARRNDMGEWLNDDIRKRNGE